MERPNKEPPEEENHRPFWLRGPFWIIQLPLLGMLAMIGFLALVMRSTGKW
jgi:hypothetical protein